jgi:hypothetical protein
VLCNGIDRTLSALCQLGQNTLPLEELFIIRRPARLVFTVVSGVVALHSQVRVRELIAVGIAVVTTEVAAVMYGLLLPGNGAN